MRVRYWACMGKNAWLCLMRLCARQSHGRYDYFCPTTMKLPNGECTLTFLWYPWKFGGENGKGVREGTESRLELGPDFREDEWQEWFRAREEDNVKKTTSRAFSEERMNATRINFIIMLMATLVEAKTHQTHKNV
ncbi:hypothetical protein IW261DRAFT_1598790 [Armillaria novae-zelandiae]|uniref:Secreted protein n=1 Tax=Armillaria novae-zelandiae TaxID=153914 RepID=A0AA39NEA6_9AGAR|nr:hypothetical protein IW261DRAFT_1598790 [Armillaria novae-zelandiae]